jgi:predicted ATP-dependent serine protease
MADPIKCPKCGSENVKYTKVDRGWQVGKCQACKFWGKLQKIEATGDQGDKTTPTGEAKAKPKAKPKPTSNATTTPKSTSTPNRPGPGDPAGGTGGKPAGGKPAWYDIEYF